MDVETAEEDEEAGLGGDIAGEAVAGDGVGEDATAREADEVGAGESRPPAGILVPLVPAGEAGEGIAGDGGFQDQEGGSVQP